MSVQNENNVVLNENSVEGKPCINRESESLEITIYLYSCYDTNMDILAVVTPPYIYHGCSNRETFWEENFTGEVKLFSAVNLKYFGHHNVRKHS